MDLGAIMKFHRVWNAVLLAMLCATVAPTSAESLTYRMTVKSVPESGGKCVSAPNGPFVEGMRVFIWDCNADLAQTLVYDDQTQQLKFGANCVQVLGQGNAQDAIGVSPCSGGVNQHWSMVANKDVYQIVGTNSLCLDISNGVVANGTPLDLSKCAPNNVLQLWVLFQASDGSATQSPPAQTSSSVQNILARHGLIGTFAENCTKDPSDDNQYILHRVLDTEHVERNQMKNRTVRSYAASVESAEELTANDIGMKILITETLNAQMKDWRMHLVTRVDDNRIRLMESGPLSGPYAGQTNIFAGKATNGGGETHWLTKCQ
jgi:Ricin-type beta-trefoil lectin domain